MRSVATLAFVAAAVAAASAAAPPSADVLGLRVAIGNQGVKKAEHIAIPLVVKALQDIKIGDFSANEDGFDFSVKSIECKNLQVGAVDISMTTTGANANANIDGLVLDCTASWSYQLSVWPHVPYGSGSVAMDVGGGVAASVTPVAVKPENYTQVTLNSLTPAIKITKIDFSGGITASILDLFKDHLSSFIAGEISSQISGLLSGELKSTVNPMLATMPYALLACEILPNGGPSAVCEVSPKPGIPGEPGVAVPALPVPDAATMAGHDVAIVLDATPLNELLAWLFTEEELFVYTVTPASLPSSVPLKLNTDSFEGVAPGMTAKYPHEDLQIEINATANPSLAFGAGAMNLTVPLELIWSACNASVRDCNAVFDGPGMAEAFRIAVPLKVGVSPKAAASGNGTLISANVAFIEADLALKSSNVGNVSVTDLQGITSLLVAEGLPAINKILNKGVAIPSSFGPVSVSNIAIDLFSGASAGATPFLSLATDINYTPSADLAALPLATRTALATSMLHGAASKLLIAAMHTPIKAWAAKAAVAYAMAGGSI